MQRWLAENVGRTYEAFEASDLPFRVDVLDWHRISESFHKVIEQAYEVIQSPEQRQISR